MSQEEKWILISGASTGIGRACAEFLAQNGFKIYAGARKEQDLEELNKIENITSIKIDVKNQETIDKAFEIIKNRETGLFGIINNAGIAKAGPLMELPIEDIAEQFEVNVFGVHRVTKTFFPLILKAKGRIVMISSNSGFFASPFFGPYSASKFAIEGYSDSLRRELSIFGVKVIIIQPGRINTPIWDKGNELLSNLLINMEGSIFEKMARPIGEYAIKQGKTDSLAPKEVAKVIYDALTSDKPKVRYLIVPDKFRNKMLKILPAKTIDKTIEKELRTFNEK